MLNEVCSNYTSIYKNIIQNVCVCVCVCVCVGGGGGGMAVHTSIR